MGSKWLLYCRQSIVIAHATLVAQIMLLAFAALAGVALRDCYLFFQKPTNVKPTAIHIF